ncbi:MAG: cytochrome P450 [Saccharothrix sp.]|nr:cytochrome P450 [Saccharothrix sp.]
MSLLDRDFSAGDFRLLLDEAVRTGSVHVDHERKRVLVMGYDLVRTLLLDRRLVNTRDQVILDELPPERRELHGSVDRFLSLWPVFSDGPYHDRVRGHLGSSMSPHRLKPLMPRLGAYCAQALLDLAERGTDVDWIGEFVRPYIAHTLSLLFGVDRDRLDRVIDAGTAVIGYVTGTGHIDEAAKRAKRALEVLDEETRALTAHPATDLCRALTAIAEDPDLGPDAAAAVVAQIVTGTLDPTLTVLAEAILLRTEPGDPVQGTDAVRRTTDEVLRHACPFRFSAVREVTEDVDLGDHRLARGQKVMLGFAAANLDSRTFPDALAFRPSADSSRHVAFGLGAHRCPGAALTTGLLDEFFTAAAVHRLRIVPVEESFVRSPAATFNRVVALRARVLREVD